MPQDFPAYPRDSRDPVVRHELRDPAAKAKHVKVMRRHSKLLKNPDYRAGWEALCQKRSEARRRAWGKMKAGERAERSRAFFTGSSNAEVSGGQVAVEAVAVVARSFWRDVFERLECLAMDMPANMLMDPSLMVKYKNSLLFHVRRAMGVLCVCRGTAQAGRKVFLEVKGRGGRPPSLLLKTFHDLLMRSYRLNNKDCLGGLLVTPPLVKAFEVCGTVQPAKVFSRLFCCLVHECMVCGAGGLEKAALCFVPDPMGFVCGDCRSPVGGRMLHIDDESSVMAEVVYRRAYEASGEVGYFPYDGFGGALFRDGYCLRMFRNPSRKKTVLVDVRSLLHFTRTANTAWMQEDYARISLTRERAFLAEVGECVNRCNRAPDWVL